LLRDKQVQIDKELFDALMNEKNVFFDTITLENKRKHRKILRNDGGNWTLIFMQEDQDIVGNIQKLIYGK
jgi:gluconate kinase